MVCSSMYNNTSIGCEGCNRFEHVPYSVVVGIRWNPIIYESDSQIASIPINIAGGVVGK